MCFGGGGDSEKALKEQQQQRQQNITQEIAGIESAFSGFTPSFYAEVKANTEQQLLPQEEQQYQQQRRSLMYNFGQRGILSGSAAQQTSTKLETAHSVAQQSVANQTSEAARQT